ncbi:hypothetical protein E1A91_D10G101000v1 [Gossypium mustelinum]|uniref:Uncharacterized protein n=5 Tax=Gossypium TaxID=3633 RepID=A0A0D2URQ1_GOSRA|nr:hypothetical protein ES319_D10G096100v1 [Gossypium barbadense]KJB70951.1 hypothetical protein B456_011G097200 [Gossypium raimondii]TYG49549.1 hypothetical protein ES288_D10G102900v1 [Gossypium darwinii]TYH48966.1 hypothetical protein ES332_D10G103900v1 [Gossypium tomentosum]TYI60397.1 hypothetical protein E1A91_D10G101000v1 [Gossypium mustelinum]
MGRSCFLYLLLLSMLLLLSFSQGFSIRKMMETVAFEEPTAQLEQENADTSGEMIEIMDYKDPGPNVNPRTGYIFSPPPQG